MATQAGSLPLRRNHESGFRNVGRWVDEIRCVPDHMTVLTGAVDCYKGCVELVAWIARLPASPGARPHLILDCEPSSVVEVRQTIGFPPGDRAEPRANSTWAPRPPYRRPSN